MNDIELDIAIAKHIGWSQIENLNDMAVCGSWVGYPPTGAIVGQKLPIPDFTHDLNAIGKVEDLISAKADEYVAWLRKVTSCSGPAIWKDYQMCIATAKQRAVAFAKMEGIFVE